MNTEIKLNTKELSELTENVDWFDIDLVIDFCEQNVDVLSDFKNLEDEDKIIDLINIKCFNINCLIAKGKYKKALILVSDIDILNQKIKHEQDFFNKFEEIKEFQLGVIQGKLKNYGESADIYKRLIEIDPENDDYIDGYITMNEKRLYKQTIYMAFIGGVILIGDIVLEIIFGYRMNRYIFMAGFLLVFIYLVFPYLHKMWLKSRK
ncbi:hypothetical protein [Lentimicrobium sp. S6]|uniref:hypothetical protein n=1 Tax=Lentimicrobium sp. S6 TaxID=2735872 RepID=UPI001551CFAF|nr:hypothetical protein [Lentimicrobium sp. S6]NPD48261.1 hypothetical protein [Lentimicrobium sp. S6]